MSIFMSDVGRDRERRPARRIVRPGQETQGAFGARRVAEEEDLCDVGGLVRHDLELERRLVERRRRAVRVVVHLHDEQGILRHLEADVVAEPRRRHAWSPGEQERRPAEPRTPEARIAFGGVALGQRLAFWVDVDDDVVDDARIAGDHVDPRDPGVGREAGVERKATDVVLRACDELVVLRHLEGVRLRHERRRRERRERGRPP
jgi:hypothetical protein